ncbi:V-type ATP synthase subunit D [Streptomyces lydicus]|uniref:V-type ATP synthase subunit D n=1 Tax=Streptomyces lydicus TaxID=47763 RepID=UPI00379BFE34
MTPAAPPPVGRAARLRLRHSLQVARRGADLLDRQLHVLQTELDRRRETEAAARATWETHVHEARTWLRRGLLLGGESALRTASLVSAAEVTVEWRDSLGVRHPGGVSVSAGTRAAADPAPGNTALVHARRAYCAAVTAAAECGAAAAASRMVEAQVRRTRLRVRALRRLRIPRLQQDLATVELALEQAEHEDAVRRRRAAKGSGSGHRGSGSGPRG